MAVIPKIAKVPAPTQKTCARCHAVVPSDEFAKTHSLFFPDGHIPICNKCAEDYLAQNDYKWEIVDKLCQYADIPFIVREWDRVRGLAPNNTWQTYSKIFASQTYENLGWQDYNSQYLKLREEGMIQEEIPLLREAKYTELQKRWGANYSEEELIYLEDLYKGLNATQNINGALQIDQALKICRVSLDLDSLQRSGDIKAYKEALASYNALVKTAEFTPKNVKNAADFDSFAELGLWLEKKGRINKFYDGASRDVIDETLKNIQTYNQRLYLTEGGIGEAITERLAALKNVAQEEEKFYNLTEDFSTDEYENDGYIVAGEDDEFEVEV